jgi:uncharacterized Rmd1/YagE family protein
MVVYLYAWTYPLNRSYRFGDLMKFFNARRTAYHTNPRKMDDVIYTTYYYGTPDRPPATVVDVNSTPAGARAGRKGRVPAKWRGSGSDGETTAATAVEGPTVSATGDLLGVPELVPAEDTALAPPAKRKGSKWDTSGTGEAEIFLFSYGTVVIWGMTEQQEKRFLSSL